MPKTSFRKNSGTITDSIYWPALVCEKDPQSGQAINCDLNTADTKKTVDTTITATLDTSNVYACVYNMTEKHAYDHPETPFVLCDAYNSGGGTGDSPCARAGFGHSQAMLDDAKAGSD